MTAAPSQAPILELQELSKSFPVGGSLFGGSRLQVRAVDRVSFTVRQGEVLGLVGESGSGKSTLGRTLLRLMRPTGGRVLFEGTDITDLGRRQLKPIRPRLQFVFQDPAASLNPRMTVGRIVAMPLRVQKDAPAAAERAARVAAALETVGLSAGHAERFPHEFSGGQRQRIGIARALVTEPRLLVADEPVSALDVSVQAQIINLLMEVKRRLDLTIVFISHDLAVVGQICDRVAVMYLGRIIEIAPARALFETPRHPYTEALLSAAPIPDPMLRRPRILLKGELPSPLSPPSGCAFRTRCRYALPACAEIPPPLQAVGEGHLSACIRPELALASPLAPSLIPGTLRSTP